jgi:multidrug resistance efflux pump
MTKRILPLLLIAAGVGGWYVWQRAQPVTLVLTGIVTANDVVVSPLAGGQIARLLVKEGDVVKKDQVIATIMPDELRADRAYFDQSAQGLSSQVRQNEAALRFQEQQTQSAVQQAEANVASADAQQASAQADLESARQKLDRVKQLVKSNVAATAEFDQAQTTFDAAKARVDALKKQADSTRAAVALAKSTAEQITMRRDQLQASRSQLAAADAQRTKADVRLAYTDVHSPIDGVVDVRAAREGEVVGVGQPIVSLINPDDLWIRADVEETYIDRMKLGDTMTVRLPSGAEVQGTVFFRGVDAGFATQRDVSRTKRDIKTFEVRLRVDNHDRRLAVGMTAYVLLPIVKPRTESVK